MTDPDAAIPHLQRSLALADEALRRFPAARPPAWYSQAHVAVGTARIMKARSTSDVSERTKILDEAVSSFDTALRLEPGAGNAQRNRERALKMKGNIQPAVDPATHLDALLDTGAAMSQQGKPDEAVQYFRAAVDFAPRSVEARIYLALGLARANKNPEAVEQLREASRLDARGANEILTKALRLPPKSTNLDDILNRLRASS